MKRELAVLPKVAAWMVEMQMDHALPIDIRIGEKIKDLKMVTLSFDADDETLVQWLVDKCENRYTNLYG